MSAVEGQEIFQAETNPGNGVFLGRTDRGSIIGGWLLRPHSDDIKDEAHLVTVQDTYETMVKLQSDHGTSDEAEQIVLRSWPSKYANQGMQHVASTGMHTTGILRGLTARKYTKLEFNPHSLPDKIDGILQPHAIAVLKPHNRSRLDQAPRPAGSLLVRKYSPAPGQNPKPIVDTPYNFTLATAIPMDTVRCIYTHSDRTDDGFFAGQPVTLGLHELADKTSDDIAKHIASFLNPDRLLGVAVRMVFASGQSEVAITPVN